MKRKKKLRRRKVVVTKTIPYPHPALKKCGEKNKHHVIPKCRGGNHGPIIMIDIMRHQAYHFLFGNKTFTEAAQLLIRVEQAARNRLKRNYH